MQSDNRKKLLIEKGGSLLVSLPSPHSSLPTIKPNIMTTITKKLIFTLAIAINITSSAVAQQLQASLSHYSTDDGLCSNAVSDIKQDGYGYIWIATWNGLSRFDGYDFYNYKTGGQSRVPLLHNRISEIGRASCRERV